MGVLFIFIFIGLFFTLTNLNQRLKEWRQNKKMIETYGNVESVKRIQQEIDKTQNLITFVVLGLFACFIAYFIYLLYN